VTTHNVYFLSAIGIFLGVLLSIAGYYYSRSRQSPQESWEGLVKKLTWIDRNTIAQVALDLVDESGEPRQTADATNLEPEQLWRLIGGLKGLEALEKNSEVLIDLAFYLQKWYPEALVIAERLRLDARELKWHVARLKGAAQTGNLQISFPFYAQRAVLTYYLMTRRVLDLYQAVNFSMLVTRGPVKRISGSISIEHALFKEDSRSQSNGHKGDAAYRFYFFSESPSPAGSARQRVGYERQPIGFPVQFAPAADVSVPGGQEIDWPLKLMGPVSARRDGPLLSVNLNNRAGRNHRIQGAVALPDDASPIGRQRRAILCREQRSLIRWLLETERVGKQILCLLLQRPFRQQHGRIRTGKLPQGHGLGISRIDGAEQLLGGEIVDFGENNELVDGKFVFLPLQAVQPTGRDLVGLVALLLGKAETSLFHLAQRELPLISNCTKP